jgi:ribosomal protein S18 acetylase RimI-like enzyme
VADKPALTFRRIDPALDAEVAYSHYRDACTASFGDDASCSTPKAYLAWLTNRVMEFPDGHVIAMLGDEPIGQLELQVPYGLKVGYVNLFYVVAKWRRLGFGRRLHDYAERYFRSWEAESIELHVASGNHAAIRFYRSLGYHRALVEDEGGRMWRMEKSLIVPSPKLISRS